MAERRTVGERVRCPACGRAAPYVSGAVGACLECLREAPELPEACRRRHAASRRRFGLPEVPPADPDGVACPLCVNRCRIPEGAWGYCGLRTVSGDTLLHAGGTPAKGLVDWYYDGLPTNCVATPVCPGGTGAGWPVYAATDGPERGYANLAVFYRACSLNCLFCQNASFKTMRPTDRGATAAELARGADDGRVSCICYFGGDPSVQMPHALAASKIALRRARAAGRILRVCFETNATMHPSVADRMAEVALASGGLVKVDLKACDDRLYRALTGSSNAYTLENVRRVGRRAAERPEVPLLVVSTLLVPGYIDAEEVSRIARFVASVDPSTPYVLLAFYPRFEMMDLPPTPRSLAVSCREAARAAGLERVFLGNEHLLW